MVMQPISASKCHSSVNRTRVVFGECESFTLYKERLQTFAYDGRVFGSLTPIANEVTGGNWNGFVFFGLNRGARHGR
jgi:hypothetical protein